MPSVGQENLKNLFRVLSSSIQQLLLVMPLTMAVPGLLGSIMGLNVAEITRITQATMMAAGLMTLIHTYNGKRLGSHAAMVIGADLGVLSIGIKYATDIKIGALMSVILIGSVLAYLLSKSAGLWHKRISPTVIFATLTLYCISFLPTAYDWFLGGAGSPDYGSTRNFLVGAAVLTFTLFINQYGQGYLKKASVGLGILFGFTLSVPIGLVNWQFSLTEVPFEMPSLLPYTPAYDAATLKVAIPVLLLLLLKQLMDLYMFAKLNDLDVQAEQQLIGRGMKSNALGICLGFVLGASTLSTNVQNYGYESFTGEKHRLSVILAGILMIAMGLSPSFSSLTTAIPLPVLGAVGILLMAQLFGTHLKLYRAQKQSSKSMMVLSLSMTIGLLTLFRPDFAYEFNTLEPLMSSGIFVCFVSGLFLELVIPEN